MTWQDSAGSIEFTPQSLKRFAQFSHFCDVRGVGDENDNLQFNYEFRIILKLATEESKFYAQIIIHTTKYHFRNKITPNTIEHA